MWKVALSALVSTLTGMLTRLLTEKALEDLLLWAAEKLAASSESKMDDELVAKIKGHLDA